MGGARRAQRHAKPAGGARPRSDFNAERHRYEAQERRARPQAQAHGHRAEEGRAVGVITQWRRPRKKDELQRSTSKKRTYSYCSLIYTSAFSLVTVLLYITRSGLPAI